MGGVDAINAVRAELDGYVNAGLAVVANRNGRRLYVSNLEDIAAQSGLFGDPNDLGGKSYCSARQRFRSISNVTGYSEIGGMALKNTAAAGLSFLGTGSGAPLAAKAPPGAAVAVARRGIPGVDGPFRGINASHPPNAAATREMSAMEICTGTDCSEIADDLLAAAGGEGRILEVSPKSGSELRLLEHGVIEDGFVYHQVYTDGRYVFDPRLDPNPVPLGDWMRHVRMLNPGAVIR